MTHTRQAVMKNFKYADMEIWRQLYIKKTLSICVINNIDDKEKPTRGFF